MSKEDKPKLMVDFIAECAHRGQVLLLHPGLSGFYAETMPKKSEGTRLSLQEFYERLTKLTDKPDFL